MNGVEREGDRFIVAVLAGHADLQIEVLDPRQGVERCDAVGCDVRTAENIKRGHWPVARHWIGLLETFGRDITDAVFHPDEATARLEREIRDLQRQLAATRRAADAASRTAARLGAARNRPQDRTSADLTPEP